MIIIILYIIYLMITTKERTYPENMIWSFMTDGPCGKWGVPGPFRLRCPQSLRRGRSPNRAPASGKWEDSHRIPMGNIRIQWIAVWFWEFPVKPSLFLWWIELLKISTFTEVSTSQMFHHINWCREWDVSLPCNQQWRKNPPTPLWRWRRAYWGETATLNAQSHLLI